MPEGGRVAIRTNSSPPSGRQVICASPWRPQGLVYTAARRRFLIKPLVLRLDVRGVALTVRLSLALGFYVSNLRGSNKSGGRRCSEPCPRRISRGALRAEDFSRLSWVGQGYSTSLERAIDRLRQQTSRASVHRPRL